MLLLYNIKINILNKQKILLYKIFILFYIYNKSNIKYLLLFYIYNKSNTKLLNLNIYF